MFIAPLRKACIVLRTTGFIFLAAATLVTPAVLSAQSKSVHTPKPVGPPLDITVPIGPTAFKADGKWHLVYELHVTNLGKWDCQLTRVDVIANDAPTKSLARFADAALDAMIVHPGIESADKPLEAGKESKIGPGMFAVMYMWVTFDPLDGLPKIIRHRIAMKIGDYPEAITLEGVPVTVNTSPVVVISPPLRGENWLAGNGPSNASQHRRAFIPIDGHAYISQRFAIDWVQIYPDGKTFHGDLSDNKNYRAYGNEIHAVADGIVTATKDGIQQNTPGAKSLAVPITLETIGGNHVIMEIGNGLCAFYAHMVQGSVRVKVGDNLRRGDVLGLLGNSGNSSEPHLHFQICNASSELGSEGLPYAFASYEQQGTGSIGDLSASGPPPVTFFPVPVEHEMEIPLENDIVRFVPKLR
jgi:murein DD-endopeptidase